jgi:hypothetical protein
VVAGIGEMALPERDLPFERSKLRAVRKIPKKGLGFFEFVAEQEVRNRVEGIDRILGAVEGKVEPQNN